MKPSQSHILHVRGLRYHVRTWGDEADPKLCAVARLDGRVGVLPVSGRCLARDWYVIAPDWRGFGLSEWAAEGYWFPDYIGDLDVLLQQLSPDEPVNLVGHSMGGNVAGLYAGVRPERVSQAGAAGGLRPAAHGPPAARPAATRNGSTRSPTRPRFKPYASFEEVEERLMKNNRAAVAREKARFLAPHWAKRLDSGEVVLTSDPAHKMVNPVLYRLDEALACWRRIDAPVLWVWGDGEWMRQWLKDNPADMEERRAAFASLAEHTIPDAGHMLHHDQPERLAASLEAFLSGRAADPR